jgi:hypothetical protein
LAVSVTIREGFVNGYCENYKECKACTLASGCSWCPNSKACLASTLLKSTDTQCNPSNTFASDFRCHTQTQLSSNASNSTLHDFTMFKNKIENKIPPPNTYMNGEIQYTNQDVVSNINNMRNTLDNYNKQLPSIVASSVENNIKPMVKGILSDNYYIQGFENYKDVFMTL